VRGQWTLRGFYHPAGRARSLWDPRLAAMLLPETHRVHDRRLRAVVDDVLTGCATQVVPHLRGLRSQFIHAEATTGNLLATKPCTPSSVAAWWKHLTWRLADRGALRRAS
jgi:Ser/Thr protein kinase RdoA (MazF antagonist)